MKKKLVKVIPILFILIGFVLAYKADFNGKQDFLRYQEEPLKIGIIGAIPKVREEKLVEFQQILFKDLENNDFDSRYDAIFITQENLSEASEDQYAQIYQTSKIPFFFIGTEKGTLPFTEEDLSYEEAPVLSDNVLIEGILQKNTNLGWQWACNNDPNMMDYNYSEVFQAIYENKYSQ